MKNDSTFFDTYFPPGTNFDGKTLFGVSPVYEKQRWEDYALQESLEQRGGEGCWKHRRAESGSSRPPCKLATTLPVIFFLFIPSDSHWVPVHLSTWVPLRRYLWMRLEFQTKLVHLYVYLQMGSLQEVQWVSGTFRLITQRLRHRVPLKKDKNKKAKKKKNRAIFKAKSN